MVFCALLLASLPVDSETDVEIEDLEAKTQDDIEDREEEFGEDEKRQQEMTAVVTDKKPG